MKYLMIILSGIAFMFSNLQAQTYAKIRDAVRRNDPVLLAPYLTKHELTVKEMGDLRELSNEIMKLKQVKVNELTDNVGKLIKYGRKYGKVALGGFAAVISGISVWEGWKVLADEDFDHWTKSEAQLAVGLGAPILMALAVQGCRFMCREYKAKSVREQYLDAREVNQLLNRYSSYLEIK